MRNDRIIQSSPVASTDWTALQSNPFQSNRLNALDWWQSSSFRQLDWTGLDCSAVQSVRATGLGWISLLHPVQSVQASGLDWTGVWFALVVYVVHSCRNPLPYAVTICKLCKCRTDVSHGPMPWPLSVHARRTFMACAVGRALRRWRGLLEVACVVGVPWWRPLLADIAGIRSLGVQCRCALPPYGWAYASVVCVPCWCMSRGN